MMPRINGDELNAFFIVREHPAPSDYRIDIYGNIMCIPLADRAVDQAAKEDSHKYLRNLMEKYYG